MFVDKLLQIPLWKISQSIHSSESRLSGELYLYMRNCTWVGLFIYNKGPGEVEFEELWTPSHYSLVCSLRVSSREPSNRWWKGWGHLSYIMFSSQVPDFWALSFFTQYVSSKLFKVVYNLFDSQHFINCSTALPLDTRLKGHIWHRSKSKSLACRHWEF